VREVDVTRLSDYALSEAYFDLLSDRRADEDVLEGMKVELEERDLLFEGYLIHDWTSGYRVRGCSYSFKQLTDLKDYISNHRGIEPTVDGSMHYCGYGSGGLRIKN
jgi:hypothetical protein